MSSHWREAMQLPQNPAAEHSDLSLLLRGSFFPNTLMSTVI